MLGADQFSTGRIEGHHIVIADVNNHDVPVLINGDAVRDVERITVHKERNFTISGDLIDAELGTRIGNKDRAFLVDGDAVQKRGALYRVGFSRFTRREIERADHVDVGGVQGAVVDCATALRQSISWCEPIRPGSTARRSHHFPPGFAELRHS